MAKKKKTELKKTNNKKEDVEIKKSEITSDKITGEDKKIQESKKTEEQSQHSNKEIYLILGAMAGLIIIFLIANSVFQSMNKFQHDGLTYTKEKFGDIPLYRYYYYTNPSRTTGAVTGEPKLINVLLRNDPRENNIPVDGEIEFPEGLFIYTALNSTGLKECPYTSVALASLASFLKQNGFALKAGVPDKEEAVANNLKYITCENKKPHSVLLIQANNQTKITIGNNCYTIDINNCEILPAIEKLITQTIIDAKARPYK